MHVGQPMISPPVTEGENLVVDSQLVQDGRVNVVDVERIRGHGIAEPDAIRRRLGTPGDSTRANLPPLVLLEHGFGVKGVYVTRTTIHEAENDVLRAGGEMRCFRCLSRSANETLQGQPAESRGSLLEKRAPRVCASDSAQTATSNM